MSVRIDKTKLTAIINNAPKRADAVVEIAARHIEAGAKEIVPTDTHALQNSIKVTKEKELERTISDGMEYGVFVEFGTTRMGARPFMKPAAEREKPLLAKAFEELFK